MLCDCLFGLDLEPGIDFQFWQRELEGEPPKDCAVIGNDPGGAFFILLKDAGTWKLMYYDHAHSLASSDEERNIYGCDIALHDFLALVTEDFQGKG